MIGCSYKEASVEIRDKIAFVDTKKLDMYQRLLEVEIKQAVIVSTCNRSEIYFIYEKRHQLQNSIDIYVQATSDDVLPYIFQKEDIEALQYLYEVCGGYQSMVLGEDQILGQMQEAYTLASQINACGKAIHKIFQNCFACIKRLKTTYQISTIPISIAYLAMKQVKDVICLEGKNIFLLGSGEMSKLLLNYLKEEHVNHLYVCARSMQNANKLIQEEGIEFVTLEKRFDYIATCDVIFTATSSPHILIDNKQLLPTNKHQLFIDIASPRDIHPNILENENVTLMDMDCLQKVRDENCEQRQQKMMEAHAMLVQNVQEIYHWFKKSHVEETLHSLQEKSERMAVDTYDLLERKLQLNVHEKYVLKKVLHSSFYRMVKEPILALKKIDQDDQATYLYMIEQLFKGEL